MVLPEVQPPADTGPRIAFSLDSVDDITKFRRTNDAVRGTCVSILVQFVRGETRDRDKVRMAIQLLVEMREDGDETIRALCAVMTKSIPSSSDKGIHPLKGLSAAQALVQIGGSRAADTMIGQLRHEVTDHELRTYTYIFFAMDKVPLTCRRLELAIERETQTPLFPSGPDKKYLKRLEHIKDSISKPDYLSDQKNWPSRQL